MTLEEFETLLDDLAKSLTKEVQAKPSLHTFSSFERRVREVLLQIVHPLGLKVDFAPHPHVFPDIVLGAFGVEVKITNNDSWRTVANSVFEGTRSVGVKHVYVLLGKFGGTPEVRWDRYENCVMHVRTSHVPRFEVEIGSTNSLFKKFGISYAQFSELSPIEKMKHVRKYARSRLKVGERLWWLGDDPEQEHAVSPEVRLYMKLPQEEKRRLRAEAALLCPQIVGGGRKRDKYNDVPLYLITYRGVLAPQARDLFSAGSVALRSDARRGGNYVKRALQDIEAEMIEAASYLDEILFLEYWEEKVEPKRRIQRWLELADGYATGWKPSEELFREPRKRRR